MMQRALGRFVGLVCGLWLCTGWFCAGAMATTITVNATVDELSSNSNCSLREAVRATNNNVQVDTCPAGSANAADVIVLQANANYALTRVGEDSTAVNGDLDISGDLIILGNGATIDGNGNTLLDRVFDVSAGQIVDISNLTITDGNSSTSAGGVRSAGALTLSNVTVTANRSSVRGGGIQINAGSLNLIDSVVSNNTSGVGGGMHLSAGISIAQGSTITANAALGSNGGGIQVDAAASISLRDGTVSSNDAVSDGGGIFNLGSTTLTRAVVSGNQAGTPGGVANLGGGLYNQASMQLIDSTLASNIADDSAGLINDGGTLLIRGSTIRGNAATSAGGLRNTNNGIANLVNSTISSNTANGSAGGLANGAGGIVELSNVTMTLNIADADANGSGDGGGLINSATVTARNTVIANNDDATPSGSNNPDCSGALISDGALLLGRNSGCTLSGLSVFINTDTGLLPLANNGGPTVTHAFAAGARVQDLGDPNGCRDHAGTFIPTDQRGTAREQPTRCDIGAVEFDDTIPTVNSVTRLDPSPTSAASVRFAVNFSEAVSGVDAPNDFALVQTGIINAAITDIATTNNRNFTVTVNTGTGDGSLRLNVVDNNSIKDFALNGLEGGFTTGQTYSINRALALFADGFQ